MNKIILECPCCGNYTIEGDVEVVTDICPVCFWQYDSVGQLKTNIAIGPNRVSLNKAKENYRNFSASDERAKEFVRKPFVSELPENNE